MQPVVYSGPCFLLSVSASENFKRPCCHFLLENKYTSKPQNLLLNGTVVFLVQEQYSPLWQILYRIGTPWLVLRMLILNQLSCVAAVNKPLRCFFVPQGVGRDRVRSHSAVILLQQGKEFRRTACELLRSQLNSMLPDQALQTSLCLKWINFLNLWHILTWANDEVNIMRWRGTGIGARHFTLYHKAINEW